MSDAFWIALFGAGCYVVTLSIRRIVEAALPHLKEKPYKTTFSRWWNEVILYLIPITLGAMAAVLLRGTSLVPVELVGVRPCLVYGAVLGSMCSMIYKIMKMLILKKAGVVIPELEAMPPTQPEEKETP
jgi:hypothetical protein